MNKPILSRSCPLLACILLIMVSWVDTVMAQPKRGSHRADHAERESIHGLRLVFYNAENLFDTLDDPGYDDASFTPQGSRVWRFASYRRKLINLGRVLIHCGEGRLPDIIGLCEIEKRAVLEDLLRYSPLRGQGYEIIHFDSRDPRGIDVALLYRPGALSPLFARPIQIAFSQGSGRTSRDILHAQFELADQTLLHVFINHWPSRFGGEQRTAPLRLDAAACLGSQVKDIYMQDPKALVIAMGDFNDGPLDASLQHLAQEGNMTNLMLSWTRQGRGTHKHAGHWAVLDQILVCSSLTDNIGWEVGNTNALSAPYLLQEELNQPGHRPFRSFAGEVFQGGFSDHLPVFTDLILNP